MTSMRPGLTGRLDYRVPEHRTVPALLPESAEFAAMPPVLATGYLVGLVEWACMRAVASHLAPGQRTVGVHVDLTHEAPTTVGANLTILAELMAVSGRHLTFAVHVHDGIAVVSRGTHQRTLVDLAAFMERSRRRATRCVGHPRAETSSDRVKDASGSPRQALADLDVAFEAAVHIPLDDPWWWQLRVAAREATTALVAAGVLPSQLRVSGSDPPVVVARLLARAWRYTRRQGDAEPCGDDLGWRCQPHGDPVSERRQSPSNPKQPSPRRRRGLLAGPSGPASEAQALPPPGG